MITKPRLRFLALSCFFALGSAFAAELPAGWCVWPMQEPVSGSALDLSSLNEGRAGDSGFVSVRDGVFVDGSGRRLRFFGVNVTSNAAFPSEQDAELLARRLSKAGVNLVRLHHLDNQWGVGGGGSLWPTNGRHQEFEAAQLDKLHRLIAILARHGIYSNINLKVSKTLSREDGFPASVEQLPDFQKRVDYFDDRMVLLQKDYARRLLATTNPYTGKSLIEDPAVAIVEINNENSLLGYFTRDLGHGLSALPEPFRGELQARWNAWLGRRYADTAALRAAWNPKLKIFSKSVLPQEGDWVARSQSGTQARVLPSEETSALKVQVEKTTGTDWHVQVSMGGLQLSDNVVYTVRCVARCSVAGALGVGVSNDAAPGSGEPWRSLGLLRSVPVGTDWTPVSLSFPAHSVAGGPAQLSFNVGAQAGLLELRSIRLEEGSLEGGLRPDELLEASSVRFPEIPTTAQWADWIAFLASVERGYVDEMRAFLRDDLKVRVPLVCSQMNFSGLHAMDRERSMDFADTHVYWEHPEFSGAGWDPANWRIKNTPMLSVFGPRRWGALGDLAQCRIAGKPFVVSEYDQAAPSDYACEMYPEFALLGCRQDWDGLVVFDLGDYGALNPQGRISGYFDQINHPSKWSLAPFASAVFRQERFARAEAFSELRPGNPAWGEAMHFDMLWAKMKPQGGLDFLDRRLQVRETGAEPVSSLIETGETQTGPARVFQTPEGPVLVGSEQQAAFVTGFIGGARVDAGAFIADCQSFGLNFGTIALLSLDAKALSESSRVLVTLVARGENQAMGWNAERTSVGKDWGHGPTIAEQVPARLELRVSGARKVYALKPDGSRSHVVKADYVDGYLRFEASAGDATLHYEVVVE